MTPRQVIKHFGNQKKTAIAVKRSQPAVSGWVRRDHVPLLQQLRIQRITDGELKASRAAMRIAELQSGEA